MIETKQRTRRVFKKAELKPFADAICSKQSVKAIAAGFNCSISTANLYKNYAANYALAVEKGLDTPEGRALMFDAEDTCRKQGKQIRKLIRQNVDNGNYYGCKKKITPRGPLGHTRTSSPIKEEGPVMVQQKLQFDNPGCLEKRGPVSKNDVDTHAILMRTLDAIIELCQAIRAVGK